MYTQGMNQIEALHVEREHPEKGLVLDLSGWQISNRMRLLGEHVGIEGLSGHSGPARLAADLVRRGESTTAMLWRFLLPL